AVLHRLAMQIRAGIWRGQRHLNGVWVDPGGEPDRLLDRLRRLAGQAEDEGAVYLDAKVVAVAGEAFCDFDPHTLFDVVQDLLVTAFVADEQQAQTVVLQYLQRIAWD